MRGGGVSNSVEITSKILQAVAYIVKADTVCHMAVNHTHDMTPDTEYSGGDFYAFLIQL